MASTRAATVIPPTGAQTPRISSTRPYQNPYTPPIPQPAENLKNLAACVAALKSGVESLIGQRGDASNRAVTFNDLVSYGILDPAAVQSPHGKFDFTGGGGAVVGGGIGEAPTDGRTYGRIGATAGWLPVLRVQDDAGIYTAPPPYVNIRSYGAKTVTEDAAFDNTPVLIAALTANPHVWFPPGKFRFNSVVSWTLSSPSPIINPGPRNNVSITGCGPDVTILYFPNSNGLMFTAHEPTHSVHLHGFSVTTGATGLYDGIQLIQDFQATETYAGYCPTSTFTDLTVRGDDGYLVVPSPLVHEWTNGIYINGWSECNFVSVTVNGVNKLGNGVWLTGTAPNAVPVVFNFVSCNMNLCEIGVAYSDLVQGVALIDCNLVGNDYGVLVPSNASEVSPLDQLTIVGSQFNNYIANVSMQAPVGDAIIIGNVFLTQGIGVDVNASCARVLISGNTFAGMAAPSSTIVGIKPGGTFGGLIYGNVFHNFLNAIVTYASSANWFGHTHQFVGVTGAPIVDNGTNRISEVVLEAPSDGHTYARRNGAWVQIA